MLSFVDDAPFFSGTGGLNGQIAGSIIPKVKQMLFERDRQPEYPLTDYFVGVDIGLRNQFTALSVVEASVGYRGFDAGGHFVDFFFEPEEIKYNVVRMFRFEPGTSYPEQVDRIGQIIARLDAIGKSMRSDNRSNVTLAADITGTGQAVLDLMIRAGLNPVAINLTNGESITSTDHGYSLPKRDLTSNLHVLMQEKRLQVAKGLELGQMLTKEMEKFTFKVKLASTEPSAEWREGSQDDLVFAVAVAVWLAGQQYNNRLEVLGPGDALYDFIEAGNRRGWV